jgi:hypothetical protein
VRPRLGPPLGMHPTTPHRPPLSTHGHTRVVKIHAAPHVHVSENRIVIFEGPEEKAAWLDAAASLDATTPEVQAIARSFVARVRATMPRTPVTAPAFLSMLAHEIHRFVRDKLAYERDPGGREEFADTTTATASVDRSSRSCVRQRWCCSCRRAHWRRAFVRSSMPRAISCTCRRGCAGRGARKRKGQSPAGGYSPSAS